MNKTRIFLVILLLLLGAVDVYFALQNPYLEANPGLILLRETMGLGWAWGLIIFMKFMILGGLVYLLLSKEFRSYTSFFFCLSLVSLLMVTQGYAIFTGVRASIDVSQLEIQQGHPLTPIQKQEISQSTAAKAYSSYNQSVFFLSILPLLVANLSYWIYKRLKKDIKVKNPPLV